MSITLEDLTRRAARLAAARDRLGNILGALNADIQALRDRAMPLAQPAIDAAAAEKKALEAEIQANPHLFEKPRTMVASGIKFGLAKGRGEIDIPDPKRTVTLIKKHLPEQASVLIDTKETPAKAAIGQLSAADLKRIGCEVRDSGDRVVIAPADSEVDKLVRQLMKAALDEQPEDA